jgi:hypothetical protein
MTSIELQILKIEGLESGTVCRVLLDNEELSQKNSHFLLPRHGIITLEFSKNKMYQGGVLFSSDNLCSSGYQYIPIYSPAIFIDNFPADIDPPRVLIIQVSSSLENSITSSRCETVLIEESAETNKNNRQDLLEKQNYGLKLDLDFYKHLALAEKSISQAKCEDLHTYIEASNFRNLMMMKNKDCVLKDLQNQRDKSFCFVGKANDGQEFINLLLKKIENDSNTISQLISSKNELLSKVYELEQENRDIKMNFIKQEIALKDAIMKEKITKKKHEALHGFEKNPENKASEQLRDKNSILKSKLQACQLENLTFKENCENTKKSYKVLKECLLGPDFNQEVLK